MEDKKRTIIVLDESGNEKEAEILSAFSIKKYNKNYIFIKTSRYCELCRVL